MITLSGITGKKYLVLGLGKSGFAAAETLRRSNADVILWDDKEPARQKAEMSGYKLGDPALMDLSGFTALVLSPGIPLTHPVPHPAVMRCKAAGVPVIGEMELLIQACPNATYVGITGTNGKSTTTALIAHILQNSGRKTQVGGNLGTPALQLEPLDSDGTYVLEMSSYQLDLMRNNPFSVAVLLNITPDHIDRHGDMSGYITAKERIIKKAAPQTLVIGTDETETMALKERVRKYDKLKIEEISVRREVERGVVAKDKQIFSCNSAERIAIIKDATAEMPNLPGTHNYQNACAAFAACRAIGISTDKIVAGLRSFPGLAHRQQLATAIEGVRFINDSKATNADATSKALACYDDIYWIIGGRPKAGGLNGLEPFAPRIRHAFIIGEASEQFAKWCEGKIPYSLCGKLDEAVKQSASMALKEKIKGSVVLLSPACASFDQFASFEERGDKFMEYAKRLSA